MRVLVTGGAGYIGSHVALALRERGHEVLIFDNLVTGHRRLVAGFPLVVGDVGDRSAVLEALERVEAILHFAACASVGESVRTPRKYFENNLQKPITLLGAAVDSGVKYFVFSSTCAVYGIPALSPIRENVPRNPVNPYGLTKSFFEIALSEYGRMYGLKHMSLRYFNVAGADSQLRTGEVHEPETHLIPSALEVIAHKRACLEVFGDDYPTRDGTCVRDYIHVTDLADAHVKALEVLDRGTTEITGMNLGTGTGYSVNQIIQAVEKVAGKPVKHKISPRRPGDPPELVADPSLANEVLHWQTRYELHDMVSSAWAWMQKDMQGLL